MNAEGLDPRRVERIRSKPRARLIRLVLALAITAALSAGLAEAASASYTWDPRGVSRLFACPSPGCITGTTVNNNTYARMHCWQDGGWYTGAYASNRWFRVTIWGTYTTWMHSSNVYGQTVVRRC